MPVSQFVKDRIPVPMRRALRRIRHPPGFKVKHPKFLIGTQNFSHRSGGIRMLYRLCYHLNVAGYPSAVAPIPSMGWEIEPPYPDWPVAVHRGRTADSIVVYPEIVPGNPLEAEKIVRWTLNTPGVLGGDIFYPDEEMVFVAGSQQLATVSKSVSKPLGPERVLSVGIIDPKYIYPDPAIEKTLDCVFTYKGEAIRTRYPLLNEASLQRIEDITPTMASLGDVLRRTRTLYSYDHKSTILKEAAICGCRVLVVHEDGRLLDPEKCGCVENNVLWDALRETYARKFHDSTFIDAFIRELTKRWQIAQ